MSEKYELTINVKNTQANNSNSKTRSPKGKAKAGNNTFVKPRLRDRRFSMDLFDFLKDWAEIGTFNKTYDRLREKGVSHRKALAKAKTNGTMAAFGVKYGLEGIGILASATGRTLGTFNSNTASQNAVDNITSTGSSLLSMVGSIGSGFTLGPAIGIANTVLTLATKGLEIATNALELSKKNVERTEESSRIRDRLGYIETGYSR